MEFEAMKRGKCCVCGKRRMVNEKGDCRECDEHMLEAHREDRHELTGWPSPQETAEMNVTLVRERADGKIVVTKGWAPPDMEPEPVLDGLDSDGGWMPVRKPKTMFTQELIDVLGRHGILYFIPKPGHRIKAFMPKPGTIMVKDEDWGDACILAIETAEVHVNG